MAGGISLTKINPMNIPINSKVLVRTNSGTFLECTLTDYSDELIGCPVVKPDDGSPLLGIGYQAEIVKVIKT